MEPISLTPSIFSIRAFMASMGNRFLSFAVNIGGVAKLAFRTFAALFRYPLDTKELIKQFAIIGNRSLMIVTLTAIFTGMVIALQLCIGLGRYGLKTNVGQIVSLSIFRELGPVLTCLMIAARVGSGIAAELGSMVVTEQVLAIEAMGANPVPKLVVPRVLATIIACPLLSTIADVIGSFGGLIITVREAGVTAHFFIDQIRTTVLVEDYMSGIYKTLFFGFAIAIIACYEGLNTRGGTEGVGSATTRAVVFSSIVIFISDFFLTKLLVFL